MKKDNYILITPRKVYDIIYRTIMRKHIRCGMCKDKASRIANIYAVQNTWKVFNKQRELMELDLTSKENKKNIASSHIIMNQYDRIITDDTHIEEEYLQKIKDMLHNGLSFIHVDDKKINITVTSDFRKHDSRMTKVHIEGI